MDEQDTQVYSRLYDDGSTHRSRHISISGYTLSWSYDPHGSMRRLILIDELLRFSITGEREIHPLWSSLPLYIRVTTSYDSFCTLQSTSYPLSTITDHAASSRGMYILSFREASHHRYTCISRTSYIFAS